MIYVMYEIDHVLVIDDHGAPRWRSKELYDIGHIMSLLFDCM